MPEPEQTSPRVAIVTGGSGGIGSSVATRLAADGCSVIVNYSGSSDRAEQIASKITEAGGRASAVQADIADEQSVRSLFDRAEELYGGVDVVVNSAGVMLLAPLAELALEDLDKMHRINIRGTFVVNREAANRVRGGGAIVNFSSSVVKIALPTYTAYAASKGAVDAMTLILAKEMRGRDITVNAVAPGPTATPLFLDGKDDEVIKQLEQMPPLERLGEPEDTAEVVSFLAGPARWVNGQILYVNGGVV